MNIEVVKQLAMGQDVKVGCCSLFPDEELGVIWGTDPYGLDFMANNKFVLGDEMAAQKAIDRAIKVDNGDNVHDMMELF